MAKVDDPEDAYETVDVAEYWGGHDLADATTVVLSQLKYSSRHPERAWTVARLCEPRQRRAPNGRSARARSVIADLAAAFRRVLDERGTEAAAKVRLALVSNQPGDPLLLQSVAAAAEWVRLRSDAPRVATLVAALPQHQTQAIQMLQGAIGARLNGKEFCAFLTALDLSGTGALERVALARAVRAGSAELTPGRGPDSARRLFHLVRAQALPDSSRSGLTADDVLAELGAPELIDLYPAPARLNELIDPLPAPGARRIADAALAQLGGIVIAHGGAGVGKTTALRQVEDHLPQGSVLLLFDCYGGGEYLSSGEERHTSQRFAVQLINELAQRCGTPLLVQPPSIEGDLWRWFGRALQKAISALDPDAVLIIGVDAADNAVYAAARNGDKSFLAGLLRLDLPDRVAVVLTARTHRVASLDAEAASNVEIDPFDLATSAAHLRRYRPEASDLDVAQFHDRTEGNPRVQFYVLADAEAELATLLQRAGLTPTDIFEDLLHSALHLTGAAAGGQRWLAILLALARPINIEIFASSLSVHAGEVSAFAAGLAPGVQVVDGAIQFRDEDFETHVRDRVPPADVISAHSRLADMFLVSRQQDSDAAAYVADHLFHAERLNELLELVLNEASPEGIPDGFRRQQVEGRRLDLAAQAAADVGDGSAAVRIAVRGCDTASRADTLSRLVDSHLDLVARYADIELLRSHALRKGRDEFLGPIFMQLAGALARDPDRHQAARSALASAEAWLRRWASGRDAQTRHWRVEVDDVAAAAEARYRIDGLTAALAELARWSPRSFALDAAAVLTGRLAGELSSAEVRNSLDTSNVPSSAHGPFLAAVASATAPPDRAWIDEVASALLDVTFDEPQEWQANVLDLAVRHGDRPTAAVLASHWSRELPAHRWAFTEPGGAGVSLLRCHAAAAALTDNELRVDDLVPTSLRAPESDSGGLPDQQAHDRREWIEIVSPLASAAQLAARASAGLANRDEVTRICTQGLGGRLEAAQHRWFTFDKSFRVWATLVTESAVDTGCLGEVFEPLRDAAPKMLGEGAPDLWLDMAQILAGRGERGLSAQLSLHAANYVRESSYSASDRLDYLARAADLAARVSPSLGKNLFDWTVDAATGVNDDAARLLSVHAELASRAEFHPTQRSGVAGRLVRAAEVMAPHVSERGSIPYETIVAAASRLDATVGLAAVSRWDDEGRMDIGSTLPGALLGAVDGGTLPPWQALALDHLIDQDGPRLDFQIEIASRMQPLGVPGVTSARTALARAVKWLRRRVVGREQPTLARRLLEKASALGLDSGIRAELEPLAAFDRQAETSGSRRWSGEEDQPDVAALLSSPTRRGWRDLRDDVSALDAAHVYGDRLRDFVSTVALGAPPEERVAALDAVADLSRDSEMVIEVLAECLSRWRGWPGCTDWAKAALPRLLATHLAGIAWTRDPGRLVEFLRAFGDDTSIRRAVLRALPDARLQLGTYQWQNIAAVLGRLCSPEVAADALRGLLNERAIAESAEPASGTEPVALLLWSAFGHPRRDIRWRAAHATRNLLSHPEAATGSLVGALVSCLEGADPSSFRDPTLYFYRLSAAAGLLVALHRIALERPAILLPHLQAIVRHATSRELPHVQIRELARLTALALADPGAPMAEDLRTANQPTSCLSTRGSRHRGDDRRQVQGRYRFDSMDTLPYWYAPLARVFDVSVDVEAEIAERWIVDRWGFDTEDWMRDARELRDRRSWERTSHRHGSIPREENLRLYLEYHAMMTAAGELVDRGQPVRIDTWDDHTPWEDWLAGHLPIPGPWLADLAAPVPAEAEFLGLPPPLDESWDTPRHEDFDRALGLLSTELPELVRVASATTLNFKDAYESIYIRSALVAHGHVAEDLQRALAAAQNPTDWKLPDEGEDDHEVNFGPFQLRGWLSEPRNLREGLDERDPYANGLRPSITLPGDRFRTMTGAAPDAQALALIAPNGEVIARAEQWADREPDRSDSGSVTSSGYRVHVDRSTLLAHLEQTRSSLILEVQIGRHRSLTRSEYRPPLSRIYLIDAAGRVSAR